MQRPVDDEPVDGQMAVAAARVPRGGWPAGLLRATRPKQWTKNFLLFLPFAFTLNLPEEGWSLSDPNRALALLGRASLGFLLYCLLAGGTYIINDLLDLERDRAHPTKRFRPLAAGIVSPPLGLVAAVFLLLAGLVSSFLVSMPMGVVSAGYIALTVGYSTVLKHMVILDVIGVAGGYVVRVLAGAVVIDVPISPWLYLCTILGALFISVAKRRNELTILADGAAHRRTLSEYSPALLDQMVAVVTPSTLMAYALYTFTAPNLPNQMMLTIPFVIYGLFRYLYLVHTRNLGGSPEEIFLKDRAMQATVALWVLTAMVIFLVFPRPDALGM